MNAQWRVVLVIPPTAGIWGADYFPRVFHYKSDALNLVDAVRRYGGEAKVEKMSRASFPPGGSARAYSLKL